MPIFPILELESIVQENDKTRLDASKSFASGGSAITTLEICPDYVAPEEEDPDENTYYDVTEDKWLDWQYSIEAANPETESREATVRVRINYVAPDPEADPPVEEDLGTSTTKIITVNSVDTDALFSTDDDLKRHEPDVLKYVPDGRATFKDVHRRAQTLILAWLDTQGFVDANATKLTLADILDPTELTQWSTMMALRLIFEGISNAVDDVFSKKAKTYLELEDFYRKRAILRIDTNSDGQLDTGEGLDISNAMVFRR